jgi:hypothetical protein
MKPHKESKNNWTKQKGIINKWFNRKREKRLPNLRKSKKMQKTLLWKLLKTLQQLK